MKTSSHLALIFLAALAALPRADAITTWDNSNATNNWSTAANWDTNIEPLAADDVLFRSASARRLR